MPLRLASRPKNNHILLLHFRAAHKQRHGRESGSERRQFRSTEKPQQLSAGGEDVDNTYYAAFLRGGHDLDPGVGGVGHGHEEGEVLIFSDETVPEWLLDETLGGGELRFGGDSRESVGEGRDEVETLWSGEVAQDFRDGFFR